MHELSLFADMMNKVHQIVVENNAERATRISVELGALSHISPGHFREHFDEAKVGTVAEDAELEVFQNDDPNDPNAQEMILQTIEVE